MKNKKIIILIAILVILLGSLTYYFFTKEDKDTTLNLIEKQWIESNKNEVIFMSIVSDIPTLSYNGEGLIIDFLDSLNSDTNLSFDKVSYKIGTEPTNEYAFKLTDNISDKDILIYKDNYAIITRDKIGYTKETLNNLVIGVVNENLDSVNNYLSDCNIKYKTYNSKEEMFQDFQKEGSELNGIILLKTFDLETIISNNYNISYNITEYNKSLVLSLGNSDKLNNILNKYYSKWANDNYKTIFNKYLSKNYFSLKKITEADAVKFRSKKYTYGYIENAPYDTTVDSKLSGINASLLSDFSDFSKAVIHFQKYNNIKELINAFNTNSLDFYYEINDKTTYNLDVYNTSNVYDNYYVVLTKLNNNNKINSLKSLANVSTLADSIVNSKLNNISKTYNTMSELVKSDDEVIVLDLNNYIFYKNTLSDYIINYQFKINDSNFVSRDINDNKIFNELLDFYINFNTDNHVNNGFDLLLSISKTPIILKRLALCLGSLVVILLVVLSIIKIKPRKKKTLTKEDKLRYIDSLTSLKNRNYLNDSLEKWDNSEVYPQAIIIVDLNNIAYINDNYGHIEGDEVIKQAANILILNQVENSEIIRTNGNEFLIYLVSTEEKQVISYIRKLTKEFKELNHGFGAAVGYSMINDAIKTVDDAINEATLDMKNNKEES